MVVRSKDRKSRSLFRPNNSFNFGYRGKCVCIIYVIITRSGHYFFHFTNHFNLPQNIQWILSLDLPSIPVYQLKNKPDLFISKLHNKLFCLSWLLLISSLFFPFWPSLDIIFSAVSGQRAALMVPANRKPPPENKAQRSAAGNSSASSGT